MLFDLEMIAKYYKGLSERMKKVRALIGRPLTLTEKILLAHAKEGLKQIPIRGKTYVDFFPDRVAMQDATAQMALLQFASAGKKRTAVPTTVHCDHLILAETGAKEDLERATSESREVFDFLQSVSNKYGVGFWKPVQG